jgi:GNAT superfamily N-acetyltransferase
MSELPNSSDSRAASADVADQRRRGDRGSVRPIRPDDVPAAVALVRELAEYERALHEVRLTEQQLTDRLFGDAPAVFGHVAVADDGAAAGEVVGIALWFLNFSTWRGTHGIYLEDLYVAPQHRGSGLGKELLRTLAALCVERGYSRLEWSVLDWNTPSIDFYKAAGAVPMDEWIVFRLTDEALSTFADDRRTA